VSPTSIYATTFVYALVGGVIPFLNVEAYLLGVSALSPETAVLPVAAAASLGQMAAKSLMYLAGRGLLKLPLRRTADALRDITARLAAAECGAMTLLSLSAVTGFPPFYAVSVAAGILRLRFVRFFVVGCGGRFLRFAAIFILPRLTS
jgi:membrane protein YqaA with SNARE-associated domain